MSASREHVSGVRLCKLPLTGEIVCGALYCRGNKIRNEAAGRELKKRYAWQRSALKYTRRECTEGVS